MKLAGTPLKPIKLYRGVRQRHWRKWVAEIRLLKWVAAYKLRGDFARLNFPHLKHQDSRFGGYNPLHSSVDAKLRAICQNLAASPPKQGRARGSCVKAPTAVVPKEETGSESSRNSSDEASNSGDGSSSPESIVSFFDFSDPQWEEGDNLGLEKYPSVEIDWEVI